MFVFHRYRDAKLAGVYSVDGETLSCQLGA